jgi:hypothetical protein
MLYVCHANWYCRQQASAHRPLSCASIIDEVAGARISAPTVRPHASLPKEYATVHHLDHLQHKPPPPPATFSRNTASLPPTQPPTRFIGQLAQLPDGAPAPPRRLTEGRRISCQRSPVLSSLRSSPCGHSCLSSCCVGAMRRMKAATGCTLLLTEAGSGSGCQSCAWLRTQAQTHVTVSTQSMADHYDSSSSNMGQHAFVQALRPERSQAHQHGHVLVAPRPAPPWTPCTFPRFSC